MPINKKFPPNETNEKKLFNRKFRRIKYILDKKITDESPNEKYIYQLKFSLQNDDRMKKIFFLHVKL